MFTPNQVAEEQRNPSTYLDVEGNQIGWGRIVMSATLTLKKQKGNLRKFPSNTLLIGDNTIQAQNANTE